MKRFVISFTVFTVLIAIILNLFINRQWLRDTYIVRTTDPEPSMLSLGNTLELTSHGDFLYQASLPKLQPSAEFNKSCGNVAREQSIVLGCYSRQFIYVYDISDSRLNGVEEVTAAHELLHAVYERLDLDEKHKLDQLLKREETKVTDERLKNTIRQYYENEPNDVTNELHSIFGTEVSALSPELEKHYSKYFKSRQKIVSFSNQYEATFTSIEEQIKVYDDRLASLKSQKEQLEASLLSQQNSIDRERQRIERLRSNNQIEEYNAAVPGYNAQIRQYNVDVERLRTVIASYNDLVARRNELAATQNDLVKQLDSKYQPLE